MASLIPGYEYDIFISYRQKDNKGDRWVSEFVEALKTELESTFKEEVSVYFDINPHDGLLETHEVGASLEEKLKCLIFIPIISQTYCDPKSFAWQYEFCAFNKLAKEDQIGRNIRLSGGNVASRILPVRIHDLDPEDKMLLETELGGVLRGIEFIYKSAGVNRPLRANEDHPHDNLNKTFYRDQINKVANAVKEIINALKKPQRQSAEGSKEIIKKTTETSKSLKSKILIGSLLLIALLIAGYFFIPKLIASKNQVEKSIAVLPFINDSHDEENTYFINGIMEEILNNLQKIKDFRVLSRTSTEQYRGSNKPTIPKIAKELDVNYIVEGSGQKYGNTFRLRVQLIAVNNEKHLWAGSFEQEIKETKDIFKIQNHIAEAIATELKATITPEEKLLIEKTPTMNLTAYDFYQRGQEEHSKSLSPTYNWEAGKRAETLYRKALEYDSTFALAYQGLAVLFWERRDRIYPEKNENNLSAYLDSMLIYADIALSYDDKLSDAYIVRGQYYAYKGSKKKAIEEFDKASKINPNDYWGYWAKGGLYEELDLSKAIENLQKASSLYYGPNKPAGLKRIGDNYFYAGFPEKGKAFYTEALKLDGDSVDYTERLIWWLPENTTSYYNAAIDHFKKRYFKDSTNIYVLDALGFLYLYAGDKKESLKYFKKYVSALKATGNNSPEDMYLGLAYLQNGYNDEARFCFEKQIKACSIQLKSVKPGERIYWSYPLAAIYACMGDKAKAYENLKIFNQNQSFTFYWVTRIKDDPFFTTIKNEPEFQKIVRDVEAKYQAEHERVRKWLEEQGKV
jgi:TolB-like protein